jgi:hypothetical protein
MTRTTLLIALFANFCAVPAFAQSDVTATVGADNLDLPWAEVGGAVETDGRHRFSGSLRGGLARERFIGGKPSGDAGVVTGSLGAEWSLDDRRANFRLGTALTLQSVLADPGNSEGNSNLVPGVSLIAAVEVPVSESVDLRVAVPVNIGVAVSPETELDILETPYSVSADFWVSPRVAVTPAAFVGGAFGYGGDGAKHRVGGSLSLQLALDDRPKAPDTHDPEASTAGFVHVGWRALSIGGHASHGPEFAAGVRLLGGWLRLGIGGYNRPGPLNPTEFEVETSNGVSYRGSETLSLKSDGGVVGLLVGTQIPVTEWLALDIPIIVGQAAFGFYLAGDDRNTPDGRRVSAWENEMQDGRDASFAIGVDAGLRAQFTIASVPWLKPTVGVHYLVTPGYDAYAKDDYSGLSMSAGAELVAF